MRWLGTTLLAMTLTTLLAMPAAQAQDDPLTMVLRGCESELKTYCAQVTPGEGRVLSCLYAFSDKLSGRCEFALYDAAVQLERAISALSYLANECDDDLERLCSTVPAGSGRLLDCLAANEDKVSGRCMQAFQDVAGQ